MVLLKSIKTLGKGDPAPHFSLVNVDDERVDLDNFKGKVVVVIFMCNHCPYVKAKNAEIAAINKEYKDKGVVVVGINSNDPNYDPEDDFEHMKEVAKKLNLDYYLVDESQEVAKAYGATCTPDPFVFDVEHKLVFHGRINDEMEPGQPVTENTLREVLDKVIAGEAVDEWFVPSMGCSIKWKSGAE